MGSLIIGASVLWYGWRAYGSARRAGTWSNKKFLLVLLFLLGLSALVSLPLIFIPADTLQAHAGLVTASMVAVITAGVVSLAVYAKRWNKRR